MSHLSRAPWLALALALAVPTSAWAGAPGPGEPGATPHGRVLVGENVASYVRMAPVRSAIVTDPRSGRRATLDVTFALNVPDRSARSMIEQRRLWLRAAYAEAMLIYTGRTYRWGDVPDLDLLAQILQDETDRLLGTGKADVLLDTVIIHAD